MLALSTISLHILLALMVLLIVFLGSFHLWSIFLTAKEAVNDFRKQWLSLSPLVRMKFFLRYLLSLVALVILCVLLWMRGHHLI